MKEKRNNWKERKGKEKSYQQQQQQTIKEGGVRSQNSWSLLIWNKTKNKNKKKDYCCKSSIHHTETRGTDLTRRVIPATISTRRQQDIELVIKDQSGINCGEAIDHQWWSLEIGRCGHIQCHSISHNHWRGITGVDRRRPLHLHWFHSHTLRWWSSLVWRQYTVHHRGWIGYWRYVWVASIPVSAPFHSIQAEGSRCQVSQVSQVFKVQSSSALSHWYFDANLDDSSLLLLL